MFYVQFNTIGREAMQIIAIKNYKLAKKTATMLIKAKQTKVKLLDYDGDILFEQEEPNAVCPNKPAEPLM